MGRFSFFGSPPKTLSVDAVEYKGSWNATTNVPALANTDGPSHQGDMYAVGTAGTHNFGAGAITFAAGDYVIYSGSEWQKIKSSVDVVSVFGRIGAVTAQSGDYTAAQVGLGNVTNDTQLKASQLDTDATLSTNSDTRVASQKAVKTYVDAVTTVDVASVPHSITANAPGTYNLDLALYDRFKVTITDINVILNIVNAPAGYKEFLLEFTSTATFTFSGGSVLPRGGNTDMPSLASISSAGAVTFHFESSDGGVNWLYSQESYRVLPHANAHLEGHTDPIISSDSDWSHSTGKAPARSLVKTYVDAQDVATLASADSYADGKVLDSIADSDTTHAPSRNAVFDALASTLAAAEAYTDAHTGPSSGIVRFARGIRAGGTGTITLSSASTADLDATNLIASVNASVGDIVAVSFNAIGTVSNGSDARIDALITSGSSAKYISTENTNRGSGWFLPNPGAAVSYSQRLESTYYWTVTANDLTFGVFSVKMRYIGLGSGACTLVNTADFPIIVNLVNLGH